MTPAQCRAASELLGWSQRDLAGNAGVSHSSVVNIEERRTVSETTRQKMQLAFEDAGVEFTNSKRPGVRLR
jgi:transcriptional regulator with XRE-family HTH domain